MPSSSTGGWRKNAADVQVPAKPDIVILIHGTGAADPDPVNPKWWEPESAYSEDLRTRLGPGFEIGMSELSAPFKWSGANSENDRRAAGRKLLERLRQLERGGRNYHLVGHSHGGSVIWHALWQSKSRLGGLKSWTSVGTPFLEFSPVWTGITTLVAFAIVAVLSYAPAHQLYEVAQEHGIILRDGSPLGVFTTVALCVLLLVFLVGLATASIRWLFRHLLFWRQRHRERRAVEAFADRWLAIWHAEDEPIAGLNASLISPPEFVPRLAKSNSNWFWRALTWPFDQVVAPVVDQFVWIVLMRRLQGADIGGSVMVDAGSAPAPLGPGWQAMPEGLASDMALSAGTQAPRTIESLRKRLSEMRGRGSGQEAFGQLSSAVTWSEILHTSYFDIPSVRGLIADRIVQSSTGPEPSESFKRSPYFSWLSDRPRAKAPQWPKPFRPVFLSFAKIAVFGGFALLLFTGFKGAYDAYVSPHTLDGQLDILSQKATTREEMSGANIGLVGNILVRLDLLGKLGDPMIVLKRIPDPNTRAWAGQSLAYHYAFKGNYASIKAIADDAFSLELLNPADAVAFVYVHALHGAYDAQQVKTSGPPALLPPPAFLDEVSSKIFLAHYPPADVEKVNLFDPRQNANYTWLVPALDMLTYFKHQPSIAAAESRIEQLLNSNWFEPSVYSKLESDHFRNFCYRVFELSKRFDGKSMPASFAAASKYCTTPKFIHALPGTSSVPSKPCPLEADLDNPSLEVGELHFSWKQSLARINDLVKRRCNDAALAVLRRHIPNPVGAYETAELGGAVHSIVEWLHNFRLDGTTEIAKYNFRWSPSVLMHTDVSLGETETINRTGCFGKCSREELRTTAEGYLAASKLQRVPAGTAKIDLSRYRVSDRQTYFFGAAKVLLELGDHAMAVQALRDALATLPQSDTPNDRPDVAFSIGRHVYKLDRDLGLDAFAAALDYGYSISQTGRTVLKAAWLHKRISEKFFEIGEYRLAREVAEKARDRPSVLASQDPDSAQELEKIGLGEGRAVLLSYSSMLSQSIRLKRPDVAHRLSTGGPNLHALPPRK